MTPGIYNISMAEYLADPCPAPSLSSSCAHTMLTESPMHAWLAHPRLAAQRGDESGAADVGSVAHDLLLGGEGKICIIEADDWRTKLAKEQRDEARSNGLTPILSKQMGGVRNMVKAARAFLDDSELAGVLERGKPELTIVWQEGDTWCRARPDWMADDRDVVLHYKTTKASASPERFIRGIMPSMGYDLALAFYARGFQAVSHRSVTGRPPLHVLFVQEQMPPYACSLISLSPAAWSIADLKVERAIKLWQQCLSSGVWPAYSGRVHYAEPTPWQMAAAEADMTEA